MAAIPLDLLDRIRALEQQVRQLTGRAQIRPALDQVLHGDVTVGEGGRLLVQDPDGTNIVETGQSAAGDWFVRLRRDNGSPALGVGANTYTGDETKQMVRIFSRNGAAVVMDDYYSDEYLGRPSIPIPWQPSYPTTSSANPVTAWIALGRVQCAVFYVAAEVYAPPNATVTVDIETRPPGGDWENWETWTVTGTAAGRWEARELTRPMHGIPHFTHTMWRLRHHVSKGTGQAMTVVLGGYQRHTFTAAETPDPPPAAARAAAAEAETPQLAALRTPADEGTAAPGPVEPGLRTIDD
ncbi:hypothetical protein ACFYVL_27865 [Streptomyces sp. NPDC004111]|uniref:hypothetical protein n=1 Tax=Streptomyces sp. NPDC004111 TaxID=3364690 RepID=UPI0036A99F75